MADTSIVYFIPASIIRNSSGSKHAEQVYKDKIKQAVLNTKFFEHLPGKKKLGIKVHFGEDGNHNYLRPEYVKTVVQLTKEFGAKPVLIETSSLYRGARQNRSSHVRLAHKHGFKQDVIGAPIQIVDGERGEAYTEVKTNLSYVKNAKIAKGLNQFDGIINLAHYKGHFVVGFGGVIKNIAMGLAQL